MARLPDAEIERLKQTVSLERLVESAGIALTRHGQDLIGRCPFHDDKTPSLVITPAKNLWHCLGACNQGGSVIDWVMKWHRVSFRHACEMLAADHPALSAPINTDASRAAMQTRLTRVGGIKPLPKSKLRADVMSFTAEEGDQALRNQVIDYYHQTLKQSREALDYLVKRGLAHNEMIERFKLGHANRTLAYRLAPKNVKAGNLMRSALQRLGFLRASGHEHFNGSLVIPIRDDAGNVVQAYGRKLRDDLREGTPQHLYLPGPLPGVFNLDGIAGQEEVILCEALIDALTFWCAGYRNVTASYGVNGFTDAHLAAFKRHGIKRVLIAYDRDAAGEKAAHDLAQQLISQGLDCYRIEFPKGMDANSYALHVTPASKSLGVAIRKATWLGKGKAPTISTGSSAPSAGREVNEPALDQALAPSSLVAEAAEVALPAAAVPAAPSEDVAADVTEREVVLRFGDRRYRVRGLQKNTAYDVLKVNVLVSREARLHVDTFDLYSAKHRQGYAHQAASELEVEEGVVTRDLGRVLLKCEQLQQQLIEETMKPKVPQAVAMSVEHREAALALLKSADLIERIVGDVERTGLVGEPVNALVGYLAAVSRKLKTPLALIVQSTSAAGKSALMEAVLNLLPEEERIHYSAMTGQSLFYLGEKDLKHKILAIAEEAGVRQASYALKLLQSQGELTIASTGKDPETGKLVTEEYRVEGPVMLFLTTTAIDLDEELLNRCLVLTVNESREQTRLIQSRQRKSRTLDGLLAAKAAEDVTQLHRNAQRLLRPLAVVNPYAEHLTFLDERPRTRRDHQKYLTLIESIALLHQHQRDIKTALRQGEVIEYIEVTLADIALANKLAHDVLGRSLDELPPQTRRLLGAIASLVEARMQKENVTRSEVRVTRWEIRAACGLSDTRLRLHLDRLVEMEYLLAHAGRQGRRFVYELVFDGDVQRDGPRLPGLIEIERLRTTPSSPGGAAHFAPRSPAIRSPSAGGSPADENTETLGDHSAESTSSDTGAKTAQPTPKNTRGRSRTASLAATSR